MASAEEAILTGRAELINNAKANPDVTFLAGPDNIKVTAHQVFLLSASEVFKAMFSKHFATDANIRVPDLDKDTFIQVLRYCYSLKAVITEENMLGILYGADKYMLPGLMAQGVDFVLNRINATNCLQIFNATNLLNCPVVHENCLKHFQEFPWKFFNDPNFFKLSLSALRKLAGLTIMNCTGSDVKSAVIAWFVANKHCKSMEDVDDEILWQQGFTAHNFGVKQFQNLIREGSHAMALEAFQSNTTLIYISSKRRLHGVGLCVGVLGSQSDESIKLTITHSYGEFNVERSVKPSPNFTIVDVMFEEAVDLSGEVKIKVAYKTVMPRSVMMIPPVSGQQQLHNNYGIFPVMQENTSKEMRPGDQNSPYTCLAYLIYDNGPVNCSELGGLRWPNGYVAAGSYNHLGRI